MLEFARAGAAVGATPATLEKTRILAAYFRTLSDEDLRRAAVYLSGRAFPPSQRRTLGLGWSTLSKVVSSISSRDHAGGARASRARGDRRNRSPVQAWGVRGEHHHPVSAGALHAREPRRDAAGGVHPHGGGDSVDRGEVRRRAMSAAPPGDARRAVLARPQGDDRGLPRAGRRRAGDWTRCAVRR